jgi:hypothetical protein
VRTEERVASADGDCNRSLVFPFGPQNAHDNANILYVLTGPCYRYDVFAQQYDGVGPRFVSFLGTRSGFPHPIRQRNLGRASDSGSREQAHQCHNKNI